MKYLKIEADKGFFSRPKDTTSQEWIEIDKINKEDLMHLLNEALSTDFEMDVFDESKMANKAHQIIYKNIHEKFSNLVSMKSKFKDESESFYKESVEKYSVDDDSD
jgi:hypothetical protein